MKLAAYSSGQFQEVINLFTDVFSDSEGQDEGQVIGQLVTELIRTTDSKDLLGYVSISDGRIIGCIFFSRLTLPSSKAAFILSPVAVSSQKQGKGLGQQLINYGIQQLKTRGVELVFTYGDPNFYSKVGFLKIAEDVVKAPKKLTYPEGWLAQSLNTESITSEIRGVKCVEALNKQEYW
ncbi:MAG: GNAT family N-acetyltransferase [Gammaproteobacteria bacterium]|nr:MAG: GNAT family N-acetyltransferase [Gammaproteobacteria bacterium]